MLVHRVLAKDQINQPAGLIAQRTIVVIAMHSTSALFCISVNPNGYLSAGAQIVFMHAWQCPSSSRAQGANSPKSPKLSLRPSSYGREGGACGEVSERASEEATDAYFRMLLVACPTLPPSLPTCCLLPSLSCLQGHLCNTDCKKTSVERRRFIS